MPSDFRVSRCRVGDAPTFGVEHETLPMDGYLNVARVEFPGGGYVELAIRGDVVEVRGDRALLLSLRSANVVTVAPEDY